MTTSQTVGSPVTLLRPLSFLTSLPPAGNPEQQIRSPERADDLMHAKGIVSRGDRTEGGRDIPVHPASGGSRNMIGRWTMDDSCRTHLAKTKNPRGLPGKERDMVDACMECGSKDDLHPFDEVPTLLCPSCCVNRAIDKADTESEIMLLADQLVRACRGVAERALESSRGVPASDEEILDAGYGSRQWPAVRCLRRLAERWSMPR